MDQPLLSEWVTHGISVAIITGLAWFVKRDRATLDRELRDLKDSDRLANVHYNDLKLQLAVMESRRLDMASDVKDLKDKMETLDSKIDTVLIAVQK